MEEHDGGRVGQLGVEDPWTGASAVGPWAEEPSPQSPHSASASGSPADAVGGLDGFTPAEPSERAGHAGRGGPGWPTDPARATPEAQAARAAVYREVRAGEAFQEVRRRYRRFAFPASAAFFVWYLAYVVAATTMPGLMAARVVGPVNVAMAAGLAQFVTTFALTWAYAWHARRWRDEAASDVRWDTQERTR